jgi:hypothetical protein
MADIRSCQVWAGNVAGGYAANTSLEAIGTPVEVDLDVHGLYRAVQEVVWRDSMQVFPYRFFLVVVDSLGALPPGPRAFYMVSDPGVVVESDVSRTDDHEASVTTTFVLEEI